METNNHAPPPSTEDEVFVTPPQQQQRKMKTRGGKKKLRKDKRMHSSSGDLESSSSGSSGGGCTKKIVTVKKITTTQTTTTTSLSRCTFMRVDNNNEDDEKKLRTQSCSSIPVEDFINNLAVFRKSFDNVNIFQDKDMILFRKKEPSKLVMVDRDGVEELLTEIFESAIQIIMANDLKIERAPKKVDGDKVAIVKCQGVVPTLFLPKIVQTPSTDNLIDAKSFVEEYEEYHDSCSELPEQIADSILNEITENVDKIVTQKYKKRKDKFVKHGGVTCLIPVETDSNAEDDTDVLQQNDKRLLEVGPKYNVPKIFFKSMNKEMTEITDQSIAENNPEIVDPPEVVVLPKEGKGFDDDDDVYKPIAVSPCGRFFKYEEEVKKIQLSILMQPFTSCIFPDW